MNKIKYFKTLLGRFGSVGAVEDWLLLMLGVCRLYREEQVARLQEKE